MTSPLLYGPLHDFNNTATHFTPAHPKDRFPVATHHLASTGALDSYYPVGPGRGYEMGQDRRRRQEGLKIDTSLASARPTPRRIASASCVMTHAAAFTPQLPPRRAHKGDHGPRSYVSNRSPMQNSGNNELNLYNIAMGYDTRTTFMIRNIPNKYTQRMLIEFLNRTHKGEYDFLYLRMDFKNRCNVGYAFINFVSSAAVLSFAERVVGKKWSKFNSDKVCTLSYANLQGKEALVQKFRNSSVMLEDPSYRPKVFFTTGPNRGEEQPFPPPTTAIRPRSEVLFSRDNAGQPHKVVRPPSPANGAVASPLLVHEPLLRHVSPSVSRAGSPNQLDTGLRAPTEMPLLPPGLQSNLERNIFGESGSNETYSPHSSFSLDDLDLSRLTLSDDWTPYPAVASDIENTGFSS
ncbi:RNA recognition motif 2-domain-containing protein [Gaertneriomyces semiglobifer]|nr:RNA recognition motif 2-domain-containing protein [Gaertneriomyces semiglobifer]